MASPPTSRLAVSLASIATRCRAISESFSRISRLQSNNSTSATLVDSAALSKSPSPPAVASGANPRNYSGFGEIFSPRNVTSFGGLGSLKAGFGTLPYWNVDFSSRLHGWGAPPTEPRFMDGRLVAGGQQVRKIFVEVKGNDLDRAIRKWRRKCKEENLKVLKDREYFRKPSEKKVLAVKERDRRIARRAFKMKLNWILSRRQRGF